MNSEIPGSLHQFPLHPETRDRAAINRENARKSAGPRTEAGKNRARFNAVRHGLSGRTVLLPSDDLLVYRKFTEEIMADLHPAGAVEQQLAQSYADTQWRLNRARSIEDAMLTLGHFENEEDFETDAAVPPAMQTALTAAIAFRSDNQAFANMAMYEQRLQRMAERTLQQLQELQALRKKEFADSMEKAIRFHKQHEMLEEDWKPANDGFVYSRQEVEAEVRRRERAECARTAWLCDYDLEKYEKTMAA